MNAIVRDVAAGSPAADTVIKPGDRLRRINGHKIKDILDYKFYSYEERLMIELEGADGMLKLVRMKKTEGADIGLEFDTFLMDREKSCANKCIFCFIDQLPKGMRETLYYKDDDVRLSFFQGNYVTLTNLSKRDVERIVKLRISPINVSVHTMDPRLRAYMLGRALLSDSGVEHIRTLANSGIKLNCQIVCCPYVNDGEHLQRTLAALLSLGAGVNSISVVPVGLTKHRQGLAALKPFDKDLAIGTVLSVDSIGDMCLKQRGTRVVYCADELYIKAELELPPYEYYEDYPQLENGVGMMRLFVTEFLEELEKCVLLDRKARPDSDNVFSVITGSAAAGYIENLLMTASAKHDTIRGEVCAIRNDFFGEGVTVSGLITGRDIIAQMKDRSYGGRLLIPANMLKRGEDVFLDDVTVSDLSQILGVPVRVVMQNGADFLHAIIGD